jgi:3-hydroxymyristoyl/3-hydroxydecanoyl-(acyl carrier protein) dehydratase
VIRLPQIDSSERSHGRLRLHFVVPVSLEYFRGHFPAVALLPGVVQTGWAIQLARRELEITGDFRALAGVKFMRVIQPGDRVALELGCSDDRRELSFEYRCGAGVCSSGRALFH